MFSHFFYLVVIRIISYMVFYSKLFCLRYFKKEVRFNMSPISFVDKKYILFCYSYKAVFYSYQKVRC